MIFSGLHLCLRLVRPARPSIPLVLKADLDLIQRRQRQAPRVVILPSFLDRCYKKMKDIQSVAQHLKAKQPKTYTLGSTLIDLVQALAKAGIR